MKEQYTSIRVILDKIMRHPLLQDLSLETIVDYTIDFMRIIGAPEMLLTKIEEIPITKYRGKLPCDWISTIQVMNSKSKICIRDSSGSFHMSINGPKSADETFRIQNGLIYTSIEDGVVEMAYEAIGLDDEGFPMIPDNSKFFRALESYIKLQWFTILFDLSKITHQVLHNTQQEYSWAVGACSSDMKKLDLSKAESLFNSFRTLIIRDNEFKRGFVNNGTKEILKNHR